RPKTTWRWLRLTERPFGEPDEGSRNGSRDDERCHSLCERRRRSDSKSLWIDDRDDLKSVLNDAIFDVDGVAFSNVSVEQVTKRNGDQIRPTRHRTRTSDVALIVDDVVGVLVNDDRRVVEREQLALGHLKEFSVLLHHHRLLDVLLKRWD